MNTGMSTLRVNVYLEVVSFFQVELELRSNILGNAFIFSDQRCSMRESVGASVIVGFHIYLVKKVGACVVCTHPNTIGFMNSGIQ